MIELLWVELEQSDVRYEATVTRLISHFLDELSKPDVLEKAVQVFKLFFKSLHTSTSTYLFIEYF